MSIFKKNDLLSLLHLKVTNIYTYNFNLYKKFIKNIVCNLHANFYKLSLIIYIRQRNKRAERIVILIVCLKFKEEKKLNILNMGQLSMMVVKYLKKIVIVVNGF